MKKLLFILTLLITLSSFGQDQKAIIYFRNGTELKGLASITDSGSKIRFKKAEKAKKIIYDSQKVDKIVIRENDKDVLYQYKIIKNKKKPLLLEPIKEGKVTLYKIVNQGYNPSVYTGNGYGSGGWSNGNYYSISSYYVSKDNGNIVIHLGEKGTIFTKNFKKAASEYFNDCSELVEKIQSKEFRKRDIVEIVEYYNGNCTEQ